MAKYRFELPQLAADIFLTDGGLETTLVFNEGLDLPEFASFPLLDSAEGREVLTRALEEYVRVAASDEVGIILETPTWRASPDWVAALGHEPDDVVRFNRDAVALVLELRERFETAATPVVISGNVGPRADAYAPEELMSVEEAKAYHARQVSVFADSEADLVTALTITNIPEAIGIAKAAEDADVPVVISFTVETDGTLPVGDSLRSAIEQVDAATGGQVLYYMVNCAHPTHFTHVFDGDSAWERRIRGVRANASTLSHEELDEAEELDDGDPTQLAAEYAGLRTLLPELVVVGGCCGTDHRHVDAISRHLRSR